MKITRATFIILVLLTTITINGYLKGSKNNGQDRQINYSYLKVLSSLDSLELSPSYKGIKK